MTISFRCVSCQHPYEVRAELAGKRGRCKQCGQVFRIPEEDAYSVDSPIDRYALDDAPTALASKSIEEAPTVPATKRKKARPVSGIVGLDRLPLWGYVIYQALILAVGAASMLATGEKQQILAIVAMLLGLGPIFAWLLLNSNQGVAFRDGLFPGLAYMFFLPYRVYYRVTRPDVFRNQRRRKLTVADCILVLVALGTVVSQYYAAIERDRKRQLGPEPLHWGMAPRPAIAAEPPAVRRVPAPAVALPPAPAMPRANKFKPPTFGDDDFPPGPRASESRPQVASRPPMATPPEMERIEVQPAFPTLPAIPPRPDPTDTVTISVTGLPNMAGVGRIQDALTALIDRAGRGHSIQSNSDGKRATFIAGPIADPEAFAAQIKFGRVTGVSGRTINVEASP